MASHVQVRTDALSQHPSGVGGDDLAVQGLTSLLIHPGGADVPVATAVRDDLGEVAGSGLLKGVNRLILPCLLYTSDAADEL